jgi:glycosyltransferase involved in cell wall biosynthesis
VLVPSYNHARYLDEALGSVVGQTFTDWELALLDDGSTDDSMAVASAWTARDSRVSVGQNPSNLGTYGTLRRGLESTSGEFVAVLNSDDAWLPEKLERQVAALDADGSADACACLGWAVDEEGTRLPDDVHADWPIGAVDLLPWLMKENRILASSMVFRRPGLRFDATCRYSGDWVVLVGSARRGRTVVLPDRLSVWRQHATNTYRRTPAQVMEEVRVRESLRSAAPAWRRDGSLNQGLAANALNLFALYVLLGRADLARPLGREMLRLRPWRVGAKRWLGLLAGLPRLRAHLWPEEAGEPGAYEEAGRGLQAKLLAWD